MRHYATPAKQDDVIIMRGSGNAPGAGGVISTVIITDPRADGRVKEGGYECRDATSAEIDAARKSGRIHTEYC